MKNSLANKTFLLLLLAILFLPGCYSQRFHNTEIGAAPLTTHHHHFLALGLFEAAMPLNPQKYCTATDWQTSLVEFNALNFFISSFGAPVYGNITVAVSCNETIKLASP